MTHSLKKNLAALVTNKKGTTRKGQNKLNMGNICESCCGPIKDDESQDGEVNSRTHLLSNSAQNVPSPARNPNDDGGRNRGSLPRQNDEQSAINRILHETATNVIDVAALEVQTLQHQEVQERSRQYNQKLQAISNKMVVPSVHKEASMMDIPNPEEVLSKTPVKEEDRQMMKQWTEKIADAVQNIKAEPGSDLVVTFGN
ncbi:ragulator complex protein LAMTOR1-like isoform X2 [Artemia franciscana]|uniref:ragulator complex protein LAMTOR1-like isoform X2 n=1 Tax=Artemia franciscana TaxID=6661 RepID=UPI0032DB77B8